MRIIAQSTLAKFSEAHPEASASIGHWRRIVKSARWVNSSEVQASFTKAKVLNGERVRFEVSGGNYRLIAAFKFESNLCFVKFIGTHAEYDRIDALKISLF